MQLEEWKQTLLMVKSLWTDDTCNLVLLLHEYNAIYGMCCVGCYYEDEIYDSSL